MHFNRSRLLPAAIALALVASACGGGTETTTQSPLGTASPAVAPTASPVPGDSSSAAGAGAETSSDVQSDLPDITVVDVATDAPVNLLSLAPSDKPILLWFYAPH